MSYTILFWLYSSPTRSHTSPYHITYLRTTSHTSSPVLPLISCRNFWGVYDWIVYPQYYVFNPSVLSLSVLENSNATLVVVARGEYSHLTTDEDDVYQPRDLIASLFEDTYNNELYRESRFYPPNEPDITAFSEQILDELILSADIYIPKCNVKEYKWYRNIQGPENGRLFWTQLGEPLVYLSNSPRTAIFVGHYISSISEVFILLSPTFSEQILRQFGSTDQCHFCTLVKLDFIRIGQCLRLGTAIY